MAGDPNLELPDGMSLHGDFLLAAATAARVIAPAPCVLCGVESHQAAGGAWCRRRLNSADVDTWFAQHEKEPPGRDGECPRQLPSSGLIARRQRVQDARRDRRCACGRSEHQQLRPAERGVPNQRLRVLLHTPDLSWHVGNRRVPHRRRDQQRQAPVRWLWVILGRADEP